MSISYVLAYKLPKKGRMNAIQSWVIISLKRGTNTYTYTQPIGRGEVWWKDKLNLELKNRKARPPLCISIDGRVSSSAVSFVCHKQANTKKVFSSLHLFLFLDYWGKKKKTCKVRITQLSAAPIRVSWCLTLHVDSTLRRKLHQQREVEG